MKLTTLKPRLATLIVQVAPPQATERMRGRAAVERRERWLRQHPMCVDCQAEDIVAAAEEVDHEVPLWEGGADDDSNFASRCKPHHKAKSKREAARRARGGAGMGDRAIAAPRQA